VKNCWFELPNISNVHVAFYHISCAYVIFFIWNSLIRECEYQYVYIILLRRLTIASSFAIYKMLFIKKHILLTQKTPCHVLKSTVDMF
jgi:hypothetical protein